MSSGHHHTYSLSQNHKAQLASAYNELGKELASQRVKVIGNYTLGRVIGEGTYGTVRLGIHRLTGTRVAIKQIPKSVSASLTREIHHHRQLHHPHVTQLYEVIATENHIWLVTELCSGGELFDYLLEKGRVSEVETRIIFGQICLAVAYIHGKGILHRDLKLENILLDERCRVKLGDFGFTREFERGTLLETFCGTTGYASPEMLQGKKYLGPEVDIWSLGIILYTLLTGTLPFDDDDDNTMRQKIIKGEYEDPDWLSDEARDLIRRTLQVDPLQRVSIPQMLSHPWFSAHRPLSPVSLPKAQSPPLSLDQRVSSSTPSEASFHSASSEYNPPLTSATTTPEEGSEQGPSSARSSQDVHIIHRNLSDVTIKKSAEAKGKMKASHPETVIEEDLTSPFSSKPDSTLSRSNSVAKEPPAYPTRTPVRTKRRSVSSAISDHEDNIMSPPGAPVLYQDFAALLNTPAPVIFSTDIERQLLNTLSGIGFDTGQIVHSVLSDACDATGSLWWMLKKNTEKAEVEQRIASAFEQESQSEKRAHKKQEKSGHSESIGKPRDLELLSSSSNLTQSAPELAFIPATPISTSGVPPVTPPRPRSSGHPLLSPPPSAGTNVNKSHPSSPRDSTGAGGSKGRKARSGSVSIMQRATTALEAAGLVKKKSTEAVRDDKDRERDKEKDRDKVKEPEKKSGSGDESRTSHANGSHKRPKSSHSKSEIIVPSTPSLEYELDHSHLSSPWVMTKSAKQSSSASTPANSPPDVLTALPNISVDGSKTGSAGRNRASLLTAFRTWFNEERRSKRKEVPPPGRAYNSGTAARGRGIVKRRGSTGSKRNNVNPRTRHSMSSRRSSSLNSKRSSVNSVVVLENPYQADHMIAMSRQKSDPSRRSIGANTPTSERDYGSRPSSVISMSRQRHRKSPSQSSAGSVHGRTASPVSKFHRREGSGSSTRVVRQIQGSNPRASKLHGRTNSTASSIHSLSSSRRNSFYEPSESEGQRTNSPLHSLVTNSVDDVPRRPPHAASTFVAQKRQTPFASPSSNGSAGRSSWKKAWGAEPPGWQSRSTHGTTIEVLSISPTGDLPSSIRDVFSGRSSLNFNHGDEDDWIDEDDDGPAYAGGLGQLPSSAASWTSVPTASPASPTSGPSKTTSIPTMVDSPIALSAPPKSASSRSSNKKGRNNTGWTNGNTTAKGRGKAGHSPVGRHSPLPVDSMNDSSDNRATRRQLPGARSNGPSFKANAIQEEDEGEEE